MFAWCCMFRLLAEYGNHFKLTSLVTCWPDPGYFEQQLPLP